MDILKSVMSYRNLNIIKTNVIVYDKKLPHILMESEKNIIVRIGIPVSVYNECRNKILRGDYLRDTSVSRIMHIEGLFMKYINAALADLNMYTKYMPGNIVGIANGDNSVFSPELYIVPHNVIQHIDHKNNTITIADSDIQYVRFIDYIVPINEEDTERSLCNISNSVKFESQY